MTKHSEFDTPTPGPLMVEASGDPDYPFCVCPVDDDGIQLPPIAAFNRHADALRFVYPAKHNEPLWADGNPANESAMIADMLLWLKVLGTLLAQQPSLDVVQRTENMRRLRACIEQAQAMIPAELAEQAPAAIVMK